MLPKDTETERLLIAASRRVFSDWARRWVTALPREPTPPPMTGTYPTNRDVSAAIKKGQQTALSRTE